MPSPLFVYSGTPNLLSDFYRHDDALLLSERALRVFQELDPDALEVKVADVTGTNVRFFLCLCRRVIDAIDESRTTITVFSDESYSGSGRYTTKVHFEGGNYAVSSNVSQDVNVFHQYFSNDLLVSDVMVDALREAGARWIYFQPPFSASEANRVRL